MDKVIITLRGSEEVHKLCKMVAGMQGISLNQFCLDAITKAAIATAKTRIDEELDRLVKEVETPKKEKQSA